MPHDVLVFPSPRDVNTKAAEELLKVNTVQWKKKKELLTSSFKLGNKRQTLHVSGGSGQVLKHRQHLQ